MIYRSVLELIKHKEPHVVACVYQDVAGSCTVQRSAVW